MTDEDQLRAAMIEMIMCRFELDLAELSDRFNEPITALRERTQALRDRLGEFVETRGDVIRITESARLIARIAAQELDGYVMPEGRHSRAM